MIILIQRVTEASVSIAGECVAAIDAGLLVLVAVEAKDDSAILARMLEKTLKYRVFSDETGRMNRSVRDEEYSVLFVPQFTLAATTGKGLRPSFATIDPVWAKQMFADFSVMAQELYPQCQFGVFGADMQVSLTNDGPVTFWLQSPR
jgi:D-aminoacyl-tRNA deacylase